MFDVRHERRGMLNAKHFILNRVHELFGPGAKERIFLRLAFGPEASLDQSGCRNCGMPADVTKRPDYDEEARKLFAALNLPVSGAASSESSRLHGYNNLDAVWKHPTTGAQVFIGNQTASVQRDILRQNGITHIVNCTSDMANAFQGKDGSTAYFRFDLYKFFSALDLRSHRGVYEFFVPVFQWIDEAVETLHFALPLAFCFVC
ncbi:unnamed protein product [Symbiodinium necroappetens]|uniref:Uncharacterized protein n=1 Tax=Symbiodinium necroappetens TaxID=1628268 RepID=A0A812JHF5_9DINO|nr:unnamed protein product [Symbiodinium necroappetens]